MPPHPSPAYERVRHTIAKRMRMSHIYHPLTLMELLGQGLARQQLADRHGQEECAQGPRLKDPGC